MSTPGQYIKELVNEAYERNLSFSVYTEDFFPLITYKEKYWSGYYSSRPNLKERIKDLSQQTHIS